MYIALSFGLSTAGPSILPPAAPDPVDLTLPGRSLRLPVDNGLSASLPDFAQVLRQPADNLTGMWGAAQALFFIVRLPKEARYHNQFFGLFGGMVNSTRQSSGGLYGDAWGTAADRGRFKAQIATSGIVPRSAPWTEDAALVVIRRNAASQGVIDWYSLEDGTKHAGTPTSTIFQSQNGQTQTVNIGSWTSGTPVLGDDKHWPGEIEAVGYVAADVADADWQAIALGARLRDALPVGDVRWVRELDGTAAGLAAPAWATADATRPMTLWGRQTMEPGSNLRRQTPSAWVTIDPIPDGWVWGVLPGASGATAALSGTVGGITGNVEVRLVNATTGAVDLDWTQIATVSGATWSGTVTAPLSSGGWVFVQARVTGDPAIIATLRSRVGAGYKLLQLGQSQTQIYLTSIALAAKPLAANAATVAYATTDTGTSITVGQHQITMLGARSSDGLATFVDQIRALTDVPVMVIDAAINGTGPDQLMDDANAGRDWSVLQGKLDHFGNDISVVLMNWATQGWTANGTVAETLEALIYGTGSYGGTVDHHLTAALRPGFAVALSPATRHSRGVHEAIREPQVVYANSVGLTVGPPISDFQIEAAGGPHQNPGGQGSPRFGQRMAVTAARALGLDDSRNPCFAGTATRFGATITIPVMRPNGGDLYSPAPAALTGFRVDEGNGFTGTGFTAAVSDNEVVLTKDSGDWTPGTIVTYAANLDLRTDGDAAAEAAIVAGALYETWPPDVLGLGLPVMGRIEGVDWYPDAAEIVVA